MITEEMLISEVVARWPETIEVFFDYGLGCAGCPSAAYETVEEGAAKHGFSSEEIQELVEKLNAAAKAS